MVQIPVWMMEIWILTVRRYHERLRVFWFVSHQLWLLQISNCWSMHPIHMSLQRERPTSKVTLSTRMGIRWFVILFTIIWSGLVLDPNLSHLAIESLLNEEKSEIRAKKIAALYARHVEVFQVWAESFVTFDLGWRLDCYWNATCRQNFLRFLLNHTFDFAWFVICLQQSLDLWQISFLVSQSREIPAVQV